MYWADAVAKRIVDSGKYQPFLVDDMFTPSGFAHIGSLRGPLIHDIVYKSLKDAGENARFTYVFNDFDPVDGLPADLQSKFSQYLGFPLRTVPSPEKGYESFAEYFTKDLQKVLEELGMRAEFLSSWDMYREGKFNEVIRIALDNAEKVQDVYKTVSGSKKKEGWLPLQVVCENCGRLGTTRTFDWDGQTVGYVCEPDMVTWAKGCGYEGRISPFDGKGKLPWKVDWPAHWKVLGVTIEGAGKDHSSAGGSRDIARELCNQVFDYPEPFNIPYEFFLIGGKKMASSKGLGLKARDLTTLFPPEVARFLFAKTDYRQAFEIDFDKTTDIPDLFDDYDRSWRAYVDGSNEDLTRLFEISQVQRVPSRKEIFIPRFRDVANYLQQPNVDLTQKFEEIKGGTLTDDEGELLEERIKYAKVWLEQFAPQEYQMSMTSSIPQSARELNQKQREFLKSAAELLRVDVTAEELQKKLYESAKAFGISSVEAFGAIYQATTGKSHGPRAAWFLLQYPREAVIERLAAVAELQSIDESSAKTNYIAPVNLPEYIQVNKEFRKRYPSATIAIALIREIDIEKINTKLEKERERLLGELEGLTTESVGEFPEIKSYRRMYKEMGVDWHSRRPSPEALLRRIALGKGLYSVNTCVDAYSLILMKNRVSIGAFDADKIEFPCEVKIAEGGERILLLGDEKETSLKAGEVSYFDQTGPYNLDFNYRDAQRTMVTESTKNLWINVEGVYDITPEQVEKTLEESIATIITYCGGTVEMKGVVV